jgi:hypothetical protein
MSDLEATAREFWCASSLVHHSKPGSITRQVALGRLIDGLGLARTPRISNRFNLLLAEHAGELGLTHQPRSAS